MMEPIQLSTLDTSIVSVKHEDGAIMPVVTISIAPLNQEDRDKLLFSEDMSDMEIAYFIKDVSLLDDEESSDDDADEPSLGSSSIQVTARLASNLFEVESQGQDNPVFQEIAFNVPLTFLSLALTVSSSSDNGLLMIVKEDSHPYYEYDEAVELDFYDDFAFFLSFPPEGTVSFATLLEKFSVLVKDPFNVPIAIQEEDETHLGAPREARLAQYLLFSLFAGLSEGSDAAFARLMQLMNAIDENVTDDDTIITSSTPYLPYASVIASEAYRRSRVEVDGQEKMSIPDDEQNNESTVEEDILYSEAFAEIINENSLLEVLDDLPRLGPAESYPLENGFPGKMVNYTKEFEEEGKAHALAELISRDGVVAQDSTRMIEKHSLGTYVSALILLSVARAVTLVESGEYDHISHVGANWLSFSGDQSFWELPALTVPITNYDMDAFVGLMNYSQGENGEYMPFLGAMIHTLGYKVVEEKWNLENLEARFSMMDIQLPLAKGIKKILEAAITAQEEGENESEELEGVSCPGCRAVANVASSDSPEEVAKYVSWSIPALADIDAASHKLEVGTEEWRNHRVKYVASLMNKAAHLEEVTE